MVSSILTPFTSGSEARLAEQAPLTREDEGSTPSGPTSKCRSGSGGPCVRLKSGRSWFDSRGRHSALAKLGGRASVRQTEGQGSIPCASTHVSVAQLEWSAWLRSRRSGVRVPPGTLFVQVAGTGRHAALRPRCSKERAGSTPALDTVEQLTSWQRSPSFGECASCSVD